MRAVGSGQWAAVCSSAFKSKANKMFVMSQPKSRDSKLCAGFEVAMARTRVGRRLPPANSHQPPAASCQCEVLGKQGHREVTKAKQEKRASQSQMKESEAALQCLGCCSTSFLLAK